MQRREARFLFQTGNALIPKTRIGYMHCKDIMRNPMQD